MPIFSRQWFALASCFPALVWSQTTPSAAPPDTALGAITITDKRLDAARNVLSPSTGSTVYNFDQSDIEALPLGASTPLNQVLLQAPGVVQDAYGSIHVRGDHANVQYRINGVVIPEPISGFGPAIDTRFANEINFLTGALPAQYGYRTAGVVDIKAKGAELENGGEIGSVMGEQGHREVNGSLSGNKGPVSYFVSGTALQNNLGIENTTSAVDALHDHSHQGKGFAYLGYQIDGVSRWSLMAGSSTSRFQIPNMPGQVAPYSLAANVPPPSASLDANQNESNRFQVLSYQRSHDGPLDFQLALFHRNSTVDYQPDAVGDLVYKGIAGSIQRANESYGSQFDTSYKLNPQHTLRMGLFAQRESMQINNNALVFPADASGNQISSTPINIADNTQIKGNLVGLYLQDEWKPQAKLTINYGLRYDQVNTVSNEHQFSPRLGMVYELSQQTRLHAGFARYFTPPPTEKIDTTSVALFQSTTNALPSNADTSVRAERSNYYDLGLSHLLTPQLALGLDAYYREVSNLQDEGQFGNALVYSAFNFAQGRIGGVELSANYRDGNLGAYANVAHSQAMGKNVSTGQFNFSQSELNYIANNWVHLDHDQAWTGSAGLSYRQGNTSYSADLILGSGLRRGFANTESLPGYAQVNAAIAQKFTAPGLGTVNARLSVINLLDRSYQLRDGSGIGVGAPQWGQRRTLYVSLSHPFTW